MREMGFVEVGAPLPELTQSGLTVAIVTATLLPAKNYASFTDSNVVIPSSFARCRASWALGAKTRTLTCLPLEFRPVTIHSFICKSLNM